MTPPRLYYVAHPVAPPCTHGGSAHAYEPPGCSPVIVQGIRNRGQVACNVERAHRWMRWLLEGAPDVAFVASWLPYVAVLPEDGPGGHWRERGLRDNAAVAARCGGIVLVGGRVSSGMTRAADAVRAAGGRVVDLTWLGDEPPIPQLADQRPRIEL